MKRIQVVQFGIGEWGWDKWAFPVLCPLATWGAIDLTLVDVHENAPLEIVAMVCEDIVTYLSRSCSHLYVGCQCRAHPAL